MHCQAATLQKTRVMQCVVCVHRHHQLSLCIGSTITGTNDLKHYIQTQTQNQSSKTNLDTVHMWSSSILFVNMHTILFCAVFSVGSQMAFHSWVSRSRSFDEREPAHDADGLWSDSDGHADDSPESVGEALLDHLLDMHFDGTLSAGNLCIIAWRSASGCITLSAKKTAFTLRPSTERAVLLRLRRVGLPFHRVDVFEMVSSLNGTRDIPNATVMRASGLVWLDTCTSCGQSLWWSSWKRCKTCTTPLPGCFGCGRLRACT